MALAYPSQPQPTLSRGDQVIIDEHTYLVLEVGVHGETGSEENRTCLATRINPDGSLQGEFIIKRIPHDPYGDALTMRNTAIRLRAAHPEIGPKDLAVYECGERGRHELSVTRLIPGASLEKISSKLQLTNSPPGIIIQRSWEIALRIMIALTPLQKKELIHRDIKDGNLILQRDRIGIGDIDLLTSAEEVRREQEAAAIVGTPVIMTPEMIASRYNLNNTTDPYQAACTVYQELEGDLTDGTLWETLHARRNGSFKARVNADLEAMSLGCPESSKLPMFRLRGWLERALSTMQSQRPQTMEEHWQLLHNKPNIEEL
jgi:serine/threonine protein kinase